MGTSADMNTGRSSSSHTVTTYSIMPPSTSSTAMAIRRQRTGMLAYSSAWSSGIRTTRAFIWTMLQPTDLMQRRATGASHDSARPESSLRQTMRVKVGR